MPDGTRLYTDTLFQDACGFIKTHLITWDISNINDISCGAVYKSHNRQAFVKLDLKMSWFRTIVTLLFHMHFNVTNHKANKAILILKRSRSMISIIHIICYWIKCYGWSVYFSTRFDHSLALPETMMIWYIYSFTSTPAKVSMYLFDDVQEQLC